MMATNLILVDVQSGLCKGKIVHQTAFERCDHRFSLLNGLGAEVKLCPLESIENHQF